MPFYPLFLDLSRRRVLVVGLGEVGRRKLRGLLAAGDSGPAHLLLIDPGQALDDLPADLREALAPLLETGRVVYARRALEETDLDQADLVFAATASRDENARLATRCAARRIWCNVITDPEAGDCIVPALARSGDLLAAFSTQGQSPALARALKGELEAVLTRWASLARFLGLLRPALLELGRPCQDNAATLRSLVRPEVALPLAQALDRGDVDAAVALAAPLLPASLRDRAESLATQAARPSSGRTEP